MTARRAATDLVRDHLRAARGGAICQAAVRQGAVRQAAVCKTPAHRFTLEPVHPRPLTLVRKLRPRPGFGVEPVIRGAPTEEVVHPPATQRHVRIRAFQPSAAPTGFDCLHCVVRRRAPEPRQPRLRHRIAVVDKAKPYVLPEIRTPRIAQHHKQRLLALVVGVIEHRHRDGLRENAGREGQRAVNRRVVRPGRRRAVRRRVPSTPLARSASRSGSVSPRRPCVPAPTRPAGR